MFKIHFMHNMMGETPEERNKITGICIICGYECWDNQYCDCANKCKYKPRFTFHNWSVAVRRFFERKLHIKLPCWLYINKQHTYLSGTTKCPYHKERIYTCGHCKYQAGYDENLEGLCGNEERLRLGREGRMAEISDYGKGRCKLFEKADWADKYDKKTGEILWNE